jgi:CheY-like chemotaxis protein
LLFPVGIDPETGEFAMKKILVADADLVFVESLSGMLKERGLEVVPAFDPGQAVAAAFHHVPDAIVLDVNTLGALFALRRLKTSPLTAATPVVAVTAAYDPDLPRDVAILGAKAFLRKPVSPGEMLAAVLWAMGEPEEAAPAAVDGEGDLDSAPVLWEAIA